MRLLAGAQLAERMSQGLDQQVDGRLLAASECHDYFHAKTGIFTDDLGNRVVFAGSINEGEQAYIDT